PVQELVELLAAVNRGVRRGIAADQLVLAVDVNVVLVAVVALAVLLRPPGIPVLLRLFGWFVLPALGRLTRFDRLVLFPPVALLGRADDRRVDDLATTRNVALGIEMPIEPFKPRLTQSGLGQRLREQPHRRGVGNAILQAEPQEAHE